MSDDLCCIFAVCCCSAITLGTMAVLSIWMPIPIAIVIGFLVYVVPGTIMLRNELEETFIAILLVNSIIGPICTFISILLGLRLIWPKNLIHMIDNAKEEEIEEARLKLDEQKIKGLFVKDRFLFFRDKDVTLFLLS